MPTEELVKNSKPQTDYRKPGDHDVFAHYYRKTDIEKAYIDGAAIRALCGKVDIPLKDPKSFPTCPTCKDIYENVVKP